MENHIRETSELQDKQGFSDLTAAEKLGIAAFVINNERKNPNSTYLEIGVFGGGNLKFLKDRTKTTQFTGVDLFEDFVCSDDNTHGSGTYLIEEVKKFVGEDRTTLIKGDSTKILPALTGTYDFIFIDGNHSYLGTIEDLNNAKKLLKSGGFVAFHNCSAHIWPDDMYVQADGGPWLVVQELKADKDWRVCYELDRVAIFTLL